MRAVGEIHEGADVLASDRRHVGTVDGVVVDETGAPAFLIVTRGTFYPQHHLIPVQAIAAVERGHRLVLALSEAEVDRLPASHGRDPTLEEARHARESLGAHARDPPARPFAIAPGTRLLRLPFGQRTREAAAPGGGSAPRLGPSREPHEGPPEDEARRMRRDGA